MTEMKCCICLEDGKMEDKGYIHHFKCYTCNDGFVCNHCIPNFDPVCSIFLGDKKEVEDTIKCPCCRVINWNYYYNQFVRITLSDDIWEQDMWDDSAVIKIFIKNYAEAKGYDLDEYLGED